MLSISQGGLERRGHDEAAFLKSLQLIAESGKTPADAQLEVRAVLGCVLCVGCAVLCVLAAGEGVPYEPAADCKNYKTPANAQLEVGSSL